MDENAETVIEKFLFHTQTGKVQKKNFLLLKLDFIKVVTKAEFIHKELKKVLKMILSGGGSVGGRGGNLFSEMEDISTKKKWVGLPFL